MLNKESLIRHLYRGEVYWLVYCCQSRALGKKVIAPELQVGEGYGYAYRIIMKQVLKHYALWTGIFLETTYSNLSPAESSRSGH